MVRTFAALSDPTRLSVVEELMQRGELPAGDLVAHAGMTGPAVSRHLKVLREAGVVTQRAEGTKRFYKVAPEAMKAISDWTISHHSFWAAGLDRLDAILAADDEVGDE
ncbi:ArsR/SmtB family transcription factor [Sulfitobacter aestuariivivens]